METAFDELTFFKAVAESGARALLIGRRALVLLGVPVLTADYDYWIASEDAELFNAAAEPFGLFPTYEPAKARKRGRYCLENEEHIDLLIARAVVAKDGTRTTFESIWKRRQAAEVAPGIRVQMPSIDDLIATKRFSMRAKDIIDIRALELLKGEA